MAAGFYFYGLYLDRTRVYTQVLAWALPLVTLPGVTIEQGILGKKKHGVARLYTTGNEVECAYKYFTLFT